MSYVIYVIYCTFCNSIFVGCTKRNLNKRISEHIADILHQRTNVSGAARHFIDIHKSPLSTFRFFWHRKRYTNQEEVVIGNISYTTGKPCGFYSYNPDIPWG